MITICMPRFFLATEMHEDGYEHVLLYKVIRLSIPLLIEIKNLILQNNV